MIVENRHWGSMVPFSQCICGNRSLGRVPSPLDKGACTCAQGCGGMAANVKLPTLLRAHHIAFVGPTAQAMESVTNKVTEAGWCPMHIMLSSIRAARSICCFRHGSGWCGYGGLGVVGRIFALACDCL